VAVLPAFINNSKNYPIGQNNKQKMMKTIKDNKFLSLAFFNVPLDIYIWAAAIITVILSGAPFITGTEKLFFNIQPGLVLVAFFPNIQPHQNLGIIFLVLGVVIALLLFIIFGISGLAIFYIRGQDVSVSEEIVDDK
jgi:hypothetical protein